MPNNRVTWLKAAPLAVAMCVALACAQESTTVENETGTATTGTSATGTAAPTSTTIQLQGEDAVPVSLVDYSIQMPSSLPAGPTEFQITNNGEHEHTFEIEGNGIERELERPLKPLEVATLQVDLQPGTYEVYCPYENHDEKHNMRTQLTVTPASVTTPADSPAAGTSTTTG